MSLRSGPRFRLGRAELEAREGESLLASVARRGWPYLSRSIRYHRPRGPFCGTGDCTGCLVRVDGRPNVRACRYRPADGDRIRCENSWPNPRFDLFGALDALLPHGIDTLRGLRRPAWLAPLYQRVVRRLAGYGEPAPVSFRAPAPAPVLLTTEVAVVGAGRAGRAVAERLAARGGRPVLLERDATGPVADGVQLLDGITATFLPPPDPAGGPFTLLAFSSSGVGHLVRSRQVVVATGSYDGPLLFEGSDRPGVLTADLIARVPELPISAAVVVGGGGRARAVLDQLGPLVRAVVAPTDVQPEVVARAAELNIPLFPRSRLVRAHGRARVRSVEIASRGEAGRTAIRCDAVVLAHRRLPNAQLFFQAGADRRWRSDPAAYYPTVGADGRTIVPGLFGVGSAVAPPGAAQPVPSAVVDALAGLPSPPPTVPEEDVGSPLAAYYRELLAEPRHGKWVVCPCEDVLLEEVEEAVRRGFRGLEVVKRYTGVGTGLCQGRYCVPEALFVLAALEARAPHQVGTITQRPPLVPTPLAALAALAPELGQEGPA